LIGWVGFKPLFQAVAAEQMGAPGERWATADNVNEANLADELVNKTLVPDQLILAQLHLETIAG
jgi:hypothetical protein